MTRDVIMPFGRYKGKPINTIQDGKELAKFLEFPFADLLSPAEARAIRSQLTVADMSGIRRQGGSEPYVVRH